MTTAPATGRRRPSAPSPEGAPAPAPEEDDEDQADDDEETDEETEETGEETPASSGGLPRIKPLEGKDTAQNGAGIVLGVLLYCVAVNYLRGGPTQVRQWFAAKFFNKTGATAGTSPKAPSPAQPSAPSQAAPPGYGVA